MKKKKGFRTIFFILLLLLVGLSGCITPDLNPRHHRFEYDTESVNIALDAQNNLHIVWQEISNDEIILYYTKLDNEGNDLINDRKLYSVERRRNHYKDPDIATDLNDYVHIVFEINNNILYTKLDNNGNQVIEPFQLTNNNCSTDGNIVIDSDNNLHVVWTDWRSGNAYIYYSKLSNLGNKLINEKRFGQKNSYDPSIIIDSKENIFVCWYFEWLEEGIWGTTGHRQICYIKMNKNGEIFKITKLDFLGDEYKQSSVEMGINSKAQIGIVWTSNDELKYFPIDNLPKDNPNELLINKEFQLENDMLYSVDLNDFKFNHRYFLEINLTKEELGRSSGDIMINKNESEYKKIGSWSFGVRANPNILTLEYGVTNHITSKGKYRVKLTKESGITNPEIRNISLFSKLKNTKEKQDYILSSRVVIEPVIGVDPEDDNNFVWYDSIGRNSDIYYLKSDYYGNKIIDKKQLTNAYGKSYDPAIIIDSIGYLYIVWLDDRTGEDVVFYMKLDKYGNKIIKDKQISDFRVDDSSIIESEGIEKTVGFYLLLFLLLFIVISIIIVYLKYKIKREKIMK